MTRIALVELPKDSLLLVNMAGNIPFGPIGTVSREETGVFTRKSIQVGSEMLRSQEIFSQSYLLRCRLAVSQFKVCPVCDSVNVNENHECFSCRWSGSFIVEPSIVESRMYEMIARCPELLAVLVDDSPATIPSRFQKLAAWFRRIRKKIDVTV